MKFRPVDTAVCAWIVLGIIPAISMLFWSNPLGVLWLVLALLMLVFFIFFNHAKWFVKMYCAVVPNCCAVRVMSFDGDVVYTVARGQLDCEMTSHSYWAFEIGPIKLLPNGVVGNGYQYFWEPLDRPQATCMALTWDRPSWHQLASMGNSERDQCRQEALRQAKFLYEQHHV